jgi:hypothetical protein
MGKDGVKRGFGPEVGEGSRKRGEGSRKKGAGDGAKPLPHFNFESVPELLPG